MIALPFTRRANIIATCLLLVMLGPSLADNQTQGLDCSDPYHIRTADGSELEKEDWTSAATDCLFAQADKGNTNAYFRIGELYAEGLGVEQDLTKARHWIGKAADSGDILAQNWVAAYYYHGVGGPMDKEKACVLWRNAAENGLHFAQYNLGTCYYSGEGAAQDDEQALAWLKKSLETPGPSSGDASYMIGNIYLVREDFDTFIIWAQKAAKLGHPSAQVWMGLAHEYGDLVPQDYVASLYWYTQAANLGAPEAQDKLCGYYLEGGIFEPNHHLAKFWCEQAYATGTAKGAFLLGKTYYYGTDVEPISFNQAAHYFEETLKRGGDVKAAIFLGLIFEEGDDTLDLDHDKALYFFQLAVEHATEEEDLTFANERIAQLSKLHRPCGDDC